MAQYRLFDLHVQVSANTRGDKKVVIATKRPGGCSIPLTQWICGQAVDAPTVQALLSTIEGILAHELSRNGGIQHVLL